MRLDFAVHLFFQRFFVTNKIERLSITICLHVNGWRNPKRLWGLRVEGITVRNGGHFDSDD